MNVKPGYEWWAAALAGNFGPVHDGQPEAGFYRVRRGKGGPWEPVAIWKSGDEWICLRASKRMNAEDAWTWVCRNPITEAAYHKAAAGQGWDDEPPAAPGSVAGHNAPTDPVEAALAELQGEEELAKELLAKPIEDQAAADKAGTWARRIGDIGSKAEKSRVAEKEPHLEAGRAVDAKWKPVVEGSKALAAKLKAHITPFLQAQKRAEEERARKAAEEARKKREEADAAARAAKTDDEAEAARVADLHRQAAEADRAATMKNASAGRTGAKVALRTETHIIVTDFAAAAAHYVAARPQELVELIGRLASRDVKAGVEIPGTERQTVERAA